MASHSAKQIKQKEMKEMTKEKSDLYTEWQRLSKLAKEVHDDFDKAHHQWITSNVNNEIETRKRLDEIKQHLIKIRIETGEIYDKYEIAK